MKRKKLSPPAHSHYDLGLLIILIALIVFATAVVGSLTGASVYYETKTIPIIKNPNAAPPQHLDAQTFNADKVNVQIVSAPQGYPLQLSSQKGVRVSGDTTLSIQSLSGIGTAYACLNAKGQLYRSADPCN